LAGRLGAVCCALGLGLLTVGLAAAFASASVRWAPAVAASCVGGAALLLLTGVLLALIVWLGGRLRGARLGGAVLAAGLVLALAAGLVGRAALVAVRSSPPSLVCLGNVKALAVAAQEYASGHHAYPSARGWREELAPYLQESRDLARPRAPERPGYAYNAAVSRVRAGPSNHLRGLIVVFETDAGGSPAGGPDLLPARPRHSGGDVYGFADGHSQWLPRKKRRDGSWAKAPDADWVRWEP
jgi:hypothetical protein